MRAGEGESEAENYVLTNPVAKTSMSSGLSQRGKAQVRNAARHIHAHYMHAYHAFLFRHGMCLLCRHGTNAGCHAMSRTSGDLEEEHFLSC